jgi:hypothetical protein
LIDYLLNETLPTFDGPISPTTLNSIFYTLERYRESGIPFTVFKNLIIEASDELNGDFLKDKNIFAYILKVLNYKDY